jgi:tRNA pseudouridine38-40 synthase
LSKLNSLLRNIKLTLQYNGSDFYGLELQPGKTTVRGELEKALRKLFKRQIKIISASRTDSGVHALAQVISFKLESRIPILKIAPALNSCLTKTLRVLKAEEVGDDFHARYDAKSKEYEYLICNGEVLPPFLQNLAWHVKPKLDLAAMRRAGKILKGRHDFSSFCAAHSDDRNFTRTLYLISIRKRKIRLWNDQDFPVISLRFKGNGFLYKMVRNLVGTLVEVGMGKHSTLKVRKILKGKNRRLAGKTAPAQGLCLIKVNY